MSPVAVGWAWGSPPVGVGAWRAWAGLAERRLGQSQAHTKPGLVRVLGRRSLPRNGAGHSHRCATPAQAKAERGSQRRPLRWGDHVGQGVEVLPQLGPLGAVAALTVRAGVGDDHVADRGGGAGDAGSVDTGRVGAGHGGTVPSRGDRPATGSAGEVGEPVQGARCSPRRQGRRRRPRGYPRVRARRVGRHAP